MCYTDYSEREMKPLKVKGEKIMYDIYPCDLTLFGECPKCCQDCDHCVGWFMEDAEEEEEED